MTPRWVWALKEKDAGGIGGAEVEDYCFLVRVWSKPKGKDISFGAFEQNTTVLLFCNLIECSVYL